MIRLKRALVFTLLHGAALVRKALLATPRSEQFLRPGFEPLLWRIGTWRLWLAAEQARTHVPAYRRLLASTAIRRYAFAGSYLISLPFRQPTKKATSSASRPKSGAGMDRYRLAGL